MLTTGAPSPAHGTCARILLVDDEPLIIHLISDMLSLDGHEIETAPNGVAALGKVQGRRYDLILTDLHMPEMDGADFYRELTRLQAHPPRKIIFLTGTAGESEAHRLVLETGLPLLRKPFNVTELLELVRKTLGAP
jgi:two-component system, cell cycle sensor histidine kinase and response regulator CckA